MMLNIHKFAWAALILIWMTSVAMLAQTDACPEIVKTALKTVGEVCQSTGRNEACYGNLTLKAEPQANVDFTFDKPGDTISLSKIKALTLSPFNSEQGIWGVALMKIQANLPDTLPGQNVSFLAFGSDSKSGGDKR
jgi:hypothetical protein